MLAVGANILYFILDSLYGTLEVSSIWDVCLQLLGAPIWGGVVWYLFALIYSCIIINYIYKKKACIIKFLPFL